MSPEICIASAAASSLRPSRASARASSRRYCARSSAVGARLEERPALFEEVERLLRVSPVELEVSQQLVCPRRAIGVLGQAEDLERAAGVARRSLGVAALGVEPRLRPVELGADARVARVRCRARAREPRSSSARPRFPLSISACAEKHGELDRLEGIVLVGPRIRGSARRRRSRIRARRPSRMSARGCRRGPGGPSRPCRERTAPPRRSRSPSRGSPRRNATWPEPGERIRRGRRRRRALEKRRRRGARPRRARRRRSATSASTRTAASVPAHVGAGRQVILGNAEPAAELAQELERGDAVARLDARDVRGRAAREGELPLAEACLLAGDLQSLAYGGGLSTWVDFCRGIRDLL